MGHMAAMAQLCRFVATHGLIKQETETEKAARLAREDLARARAAEITKTRNDYLEFWTRKYEKISDASAILNFEYALENVHNKSLHFYYGDTWAKDIYSKLRYPDLHCEALMATHTKVLSQHARDLVFEAYHGKGYYNYPDVTPQEKHRIFVIGRVCNWWRQGEGWRGC